MIRVQSESLALVGATVIDGTGASPNDDAVILIEKARIIACAPQELRKKVKGQVFGSSFLIWSFGQPLK